MTDDATPPTVTSPPSSPTPPPPPAPAEPSVAWQAPVEPRGPAPGVEFAPHGARLVAYLLDGLLLFCTFLVLMIPLVVVSAGMARDGSPPDVGTILILVLIFLVMLLLAFGYFPFFWARGGQTPGMRPFGLWVVRDQDGSSIGWGTASLRLLGLYVASSVFYLGLIWILIDKRHRGWHDLIASTVVVRRTKGPDRQEG
jgi:uncharacterized RDD family membrane protein YckC